MLGDLESKFFTVVQPLWATFKIAFEFTLR